MMDGSFVKEMRAGFTQPISVPGAPESFVVPAGWTRIDPTQHAPKSLIVESLTGLRDYVHANVDELATDELMLLVQSPSSVVLVEKCGTEADRFRRNEWVRASATVSPFGFAEYQSVEAFIIRVQSQFAQSAERDTMLSLVAGIREQEIRDTTDDGIAQQVVVQSGAAVLKREKVKNPWMLRPFRTFREVEQPESGFLLRIKGENGPRVALFECDGGLWRGVAQQNIAAWLREKVAAVEVIG